MYTRFFHEVLAQRDCGLAPYRLWCVLRISGGHGVDAAHHDLLPQRSAPLVLPQILGGRGVFLDGDRGLRTDVPDAGRSIGTDLGDARAIRGSSGRRGSFY